MYKRITLNIPIYDPGQDSRINLLKVPAGHTYTLEGWEVVNDRAIGASTANYVEFTLENGGTSGTAQTEISGTLGGTLAWAAQVAKAGTVTAGAGDLTAGQYLVLNYMETGTIGANIFSVLLDLVDGVGAKA